MPIKYRFMLGAFLTCLVLFWMSGAPLQRGWGLWGAGVLTAITTLISLAIGQGVEHSIKEREEEFRDE